MDEKDFNLKSAYLDRRWTFPRVCPHCQIYTSMRLLYCRSYPVAEFNDHYYYSCSGEVLRCLECDNIVNLTHTSVAQYSKTRSVYFKYDINDDQ